MRTLFAIERSDVCLMLIDANEGKKAVKVIEKIYTSSKNSKK